MTRLILITGCSGGGKSTLLGALQAAGYRTVPEPGRRIVAQELRGTGSALPWVDMAAFARRALAQSRTDLASARMAPGPVFFDRGLIDAAVALDHAAAIPLHDTLGAESPYDNPVFLAPPWPQIFANDPERRHDLTSAIAEYDRIAAALHRLGHRVSILPKAPVQARLEFVLNALA